MHRKAFVLTAVAAMAVTLILSTAGKPDVSASLIDQAYDRAERHLNGSVHGHEPISGKVIYDLSRCDGDDRTTHEHAHEGEHSH